MDRCRLCGDTRTLTPDGVCEWQAGCEHRQMQAAVADASFDVEYAYWFVPMACGHTAREHFESLGALLADHARLVEDRLLGELGDDEQG